MPGSECLAKTSREERTTPHLGNVLSGHSFIVSDLNFDFACPYKQWDTISAYRYIYI